MSIEKDSYRYICQLLKRETGIVLDESKEYLVESRLSQLARREGLSGVEDICKKLLARDPVVTSQVLEVMTTNETSFFRDQHPFDVLHAHVIPQLMENNKASRRIKVWSAASSSGQEAYSIAMLIRENFPELASWKVEIIGTDISTEMVKRAGSGVYSQLEVNRGLPAKMLVKYFRKDGHEWIIKDDVRNMVKFQQINLASAAGVVDSCDLIFMRNVLIYFDIETKKNILSRVRRCLRPEGYFFLGAAETTLYVDDSFERHNLDTSSCYRLKKMP